MKPFEILIRHFWAALLGVTVLNGIIFKRRSRQRVEEDPQLAGRCRSFVRGWLIWMNLPWLVMGIGSTNLLDPQVLVHVGAIENNAYWDWQRHAAVGIVLAQGRVQHNESSKIYYYLRTGLPVVCETPVPNAGLLTELGHGLLCAYDDTDEMADQAAWFCHHPPENHRVIERMIVEHSWDLRAAMYDDLLMQALPQAVSGSCR